MNALRRGELDSLLVRLACAYGRLDDVDQRVLHDDTFNGLSDAVFTAPTAVSIASEPSSILCLFYFASSSLSWLRMPTRGMLFRRAREGSLRMQGVLPLMPVGADSRRADLASGRRSCVSSYLVVPHFEARRVFALETLDVAPGAPGLIWRQRSFRGCVLAPLAARIEEFTRSYPVSYTCAG